MLIIKTVNHKKKRKKTTSMKHQLHPQEEIDMMKNLLKRSHKMQALQKFLPHI
jgi:hypothetical protein